MKGFEHMTEAPTDESWWSLCVEAAKEQVQLMATSGWEDMTEADIARIGRQRSPAPIRSDSGAVKSPDKGKVAQTGGQARKGSKYRAVPCIVTSDLTLFSKEDIETADQASGEPLRGTGKLVQQAARSGIYGIWFASLKEGKRYLELRRLELAGSVRDLRLQVPFSLDVNGTTIGRWVADFVYFECGPNDHGPWQCVREDTKGIRTPVYRRSKAHVEAQYNFTIRET